MTIRRFLFAAAAVALAITLSGCATPQSSDYASEKPTLSLRDYFSGTLDAHGMFQNRAGKVIKRFTVVIECTWRGDDGVLDEAFTFSDGTTQRRVWKLRSLPDGRFTGTADDVIGIAQGQQSGNAIHWTYTLRQPVDDTTYDVQMDDWMMAVDDRVVLNRTVMSKFGIRVGEATLSFRTR